MRLLAAFALPLALAAPAAAEVTVQVVPGPAGQPAQVDLTARAAPLAEVLDRLSRQIGMKVVYEGAQPRQLVTLSLQGRTPAEAVLGLLEGQGLNYALVANPAGTGVETLLVAGTSPVGSGSSTASPSSSARPSFTTPFRRPLTPPPGSSPDAMAEPDDQEDDSFNEPAEAEPAVDAPEPGAAQTDPGTPNPVPVPGAPGARGPVVPAQSFPVSPFAPQATPYVPQPFPPLPPGVPGAPAAQQPEQPQNPNN